MNKEILLSICIPTYNRASYLDLCLQSLTHYDAEKVEILIQDNDSQDTTQEVVKKYRNLNIKYKKNEKNIGAVKNCWTLINRAKGKYIFFLTDDDYLLPGGIERVIDFIEASNPVCFKTSLIMLLEKSKQCNYYKIKNLSKESLFLFSHILTGLCFNKQKLFEKYEEKFNENIYPSMAIMGLLLDNATYLDEPIAMHIWENEVFWEENMEPGSNNLRDELTKLIILL
ncbi:glycosyltransferase family 2 protein, partial [Sulfurovum riftiae]|uniref:glycosyltransferase family 2 protein n=1 Tax=Sulfurovum riftiae TaxID=1630136 RepID=UPI000AF2B86E